MADQKANRVTIPLDGALNMNRYRAEVKQFAGFQDNNSDIYGGIISPFWKKEEAASNCVFAPDGTKYKLVNTSLVKETDGGDVAVMTGIKNKIFKRQSYSFNIDFADINMSGGQGRACLGKIDHDNNVLKLYFGSVISGDFDALLETEAIEINPVINGNENAVIQWAQIRNIPDQDYWVGCAYVTDDNVSLPDYIYIFWWTGTNISNRKSTTAIIYSNITKPQDKYLIAYNHGYFIMQTSSQNGYRFANSSSDSYNDGDMTIFVNASSPITSAFVGEWRLRLSSDYPSQDDFQGLLTLVPMENGIVVPAFINYTASTTRHIFYIDSITQTQETPTSKTETVVTVSATNLETTHQKYSLASYSRTQCYSRGAGFDNDTELNVYYCEIAEAGRMQSLCSCNFTYDGDTFRPAWNSAYPLAKQGKKQENCFRLLIGTASGEPYIQGISYNDSGTLVEEWNTIDDSFEIAYGTNSVLYRLSNGEFRFCYVNSGSQQIKLVENRYIVMNTTSILNCYDIQLGKAVHYASDYNGRCICASTSESIEITFKPGTYYIGTGVNPRYELSKSGIISYQTNPLVLSGVPKEFDLMNDLVKFQTLYPTDGETVDVFSGKTAPDYVESITNGKHTVNFQLDGTTFPIATDGNVIYSPDIFLEYLNSYVGADMVLSGTTSYQLIYNNLQPILAYYLYTMQENVKALFVIQGQTYILQNDYIASVSYSGGVISGTQNIAYVANLQYVGNDTKKALFYSKINRSFYVFTGANDMTLLCECDKIKDVIGFLYNYITQEIHIFTIDEKISNGTVTESCCMYIFGKSIIRIEDIAGQSALLSGTVPFSSLTPTENFVILNGSSGTLYLSHNKLDGFTRLPVKIKTEYYGTGNNEVNIFDCWYIRLFNSNSAENGTVKVNVSALTDRGTTQEAKTLNIKATDWDSLTNSLLFRFQPKLQRGTGASLELESDFAVAEIGVDYKTDTQQVARINI